MINFRGVDSEKNALSNRVDVFLDPESSRHVKKSWMGYGCWPKNRGGKPPQIIHFNGVFPYKPSILGYHYFWKTPIWLANQGSCPYMTLEQLSAARFHHLKSLFCSSCLLGDVFGVHYNLQVTQTKMNDVPSKCWKLLSSLKTNGCFKGWSNIPFMNKIILLMAAILHQNNLS